MKEPLICYLICIALTAICVYTQGLGSPVADITWFLAMFSLMAVPLIAVRRIHPRDEAAAGVTISWSSKDLLMGLAAIGLLLVPVALGNHFVRTVIQGLEFHFAWSNYAALQTPLYYEIIIQLLCVALPEEFFYRGYLQTAFLTTFKQHPKCGKTAPVLAILLASLCFACAHLPSGNVTRLLTFFPGLLFGFLRHRSGGLLGAIVCHAACNLMMAVLNVHYF